MDSHTGALSLLDIMTCQDRTGEFSSVVLSLQKFHVRDFRSLALSYLFCIAFLLSVTKQLLEEESSKTFRSHVHSKVRKSVFVLNRRAWHFNGLMVGINWVPLCRPMYVAKGAFTVLYCVMQVPE